MPHAYRDERLDQHLHAMLGGVDAATLAWLREQLEWVEVAAGQTLMSQGDAGDSVYLVISGRLRAYVNDEGGVGRRVREMGRGQVIGELSLYTDEPRSATVVAIRDAVLVRLSKEHFLRLLERSVSVSVALTRQIIQRLRSVQPPAELAQPVTVGLLPLSDGVDAPGFARRLAAELEGRLGGGRVCVFDAARIDAELGAAGLARSDAADANRRIALHLDRAEAEHAMVLLVADDEPSAWTQRCTRRCDELLLLADAARAPALHASELAFMIQRPGRAEVAETLLLLHPADSRCPRGTRDWLARRPVAGHVHLRSGLRRDMARLARLLTRQGVGLVLAGGGARGLSHLGLLRALQERGVEIDVVGGTSIGAVIAAMVAADRPLDELMQVARRSFGAALRGDYNPVPLLSLISGRRVRRVIDATVRDTLGHDADIEDLYKSCYAVATNYTQADMQVLAHGRLAKALLASTAVPGALPPVLHGGELLCDGGSFNNFPVDVMRAMRGVGKVIGGDLSFRQPQRHPLDEVPGPWALLRDRLRPRAQRRYAFPSLVAYLVGVTVLYSTSRQRQTRQLADLYFNPPLQGVQLLQWEKFESVVQQGYAHAVQVLAALDDDALRPYRG